MELSVINETSGVTVSDTSFGVEFKETLIHQVVTAYLQGGRAGTKAQKTRAEVRGGGKKPWRQKGTGRARAGTIRSPLWQGGGTMFAAQPRDHSQKVNRKMYRAALKSILSEFVRQERLIVVRDLELSEPRTKQFVTKLNELGAEKNKVLVVSENDSANLRLASRNLPGAHVADVNGINPVSLVNSEKLIVTVGALNRIEEWLS